MIKSKSEMSEEIIIDLTGPEGNAFSLLGMVQTLGKQLGMDREEIRFIQDSMTHGDYEHLLEVFEEYFGNYVTLYR